MSASPEVPPALWKYGDVAEYADVAERTIRKWVAKGIGPQPVRLGGQVRFRVADVREWVDRQIAQESA